MKKTYQITEYGSFITGRKVDGYVTLPESTFFALENFVLTNRSKETDALELMGLSARKGIGKVITAKNYVGVVSMKDGTTIEILPKIYSLVETSPEKTKKLLVEMLKTLKNSPYKNLQTTSVNVDKMSIFEIFIRMFLDEVFYIAKRGLKCSYETIQSNEDFFKGKILFSQQIIHNYAHKERCYVEYDEFNINRVENRLLKATLQYLYRKTNSSKNKTDIKTLLNSFTDVDASINYEQDFAKIVADRNTMDYTTALRWCKVFLTGKSFTSFAGSEVAIALLFPMEVLFESYIATMLRKVVDSSVYSVSTQDKSYYLFDAPNKKFLIKPDIVIKDKHNKEIIIMDTKWKVLSDYKVNWGISQSDMYQMYAYQKKYEAKSVTLLYPLTELVKTDNIQFISDDGVLVKVKFLDLFNIKESLKQMLDEVVAV